jgi:o-succinylbenzoate synthase
MADLLKLKVDFVKYSLKFKFDAGTSRGILKSKDTYLIRVSSEEQRGVAGYGEAGPLTGLSVDDRLDFEEKLEEFCLKISNFKVPDKVEDILFFLQVHIPSEFPSIRFGMEVAMLDWINGGQKKILNNPFYDFNRPILINGLIWMGDRDFMLHQIDQKLGEGFKCIKMKIGSIDFDQECELLSFIRQKFSPEEVSLRVDANGAFSNKEALSKLQRLEEFSLHSIEQPIGAGQSENMSLLCRQSPIPIALDEDLIGIYSREQKNKVLETIQPQYIIIKPTLLGGIHSSREWIELADQNGIGWWGTSALESNVGLNAISQFTSSYDPELPQGLGTGQLYHNNFQSPLKVHQGNLYYENNLPWGNLDEIFSGSGPL